MKILAMVGEPATGKTTIAMKLLSKLRPGHVFKTGLLVGTFHHEDRVIVLGDYTDPSQTFGGTDRLSMAVQRDAESFMSSLALSYPTYRVFFEGDRLGNKSFLSLCKTVGELKLIVLTASDIEKSRRHQVRNDSQSSKFLKGRRTKINNLISAFPDADIRVNEARDEIHEVLRDVQTFLGLPT